VKKILPAAFAVAALAFAFAGPAAADQTYPDATGENAAAADISSIAVANSPTAATVTVKVTLANRPTLDPTSGILVFLDTDRNGATGDPGGFEYLFTLDATGYQWLKWDGTQFSDAGVQLPVTFSNGVATFTLTTADIGGVGSFDFAALTVSGPDPNNPVTDVAPETNQPLFTYTLVAAPAAPAPTTVKGTTVTVNGPPKSGKKFVVGPYSVNLSDGTSINLAGVKCTATLGAAKLKGTGAGGCTFALPKTAKGKKLTVKVSGKAAKVTLTKTLSYRVK
jgi:hypothetical protein